MSVQFEFLTETNHNPNHKPEPQMKESPVYVPRTVSPHVPCIVSFSQPALAALSRAKLSPWLIADLLSFGRARLAGQAKDGRRYYVFQNPRNKKIESIILSSDLACVITVFEGRPDTLENAGATELRNLARVVYYTPEFSNEVSDRKFGVSIFTQYRRVVGQHFDPQVHERKFPFTLQHSLSTRVVGQLLRTGALRDAIKNCVEWREKNTVPIGLTIDGIRLPLSAVLACPEERRHFPWAFSEKCAGAVA